MKNNKQEMREMGLPVPPEELDMEWDSNVITPGTPFMDKLANYLRFYIAERINTSKAWQQIKVPRVFSIEMGGRDGGGVEKCHAWPRL
jgi:5'-3' exoribonuclease 2